MPVEEFQRPVIKPAGSGEATEDPIQNLLKSLKYTSASRFNAAKRLERKERRFVQIISFISVGIVAATLLPYFLQLTRGAVNVLNFSTVVLSITILVFSLLQRSTDDSVKAEQHHRSALEINEVRRELLAIRPAASQSDIIEFTKRYNVILQKYSINHEDIDYKKALIDRPEENEWISVWRRIRIQIRIACYEGLPYLIVTLIAALLIWLMLSPEISSRFISPGGF